MLAQQAKSAPPVPPAEPQRAADKEKVQENEKEYDPDSVFAKLKSLKLPQGGA